MLGQRKRNAKPASFGYEPNPELAEVQIRDLAKSMNRVRIKTSMVGKSDSTRLVFLELTPVQEELRSLVEQWKKSGPNLRKLFKDRPDLEALTRDGKTTFWPTDSGRGHLDWEAVPSQSGTNAPLEEAAQALMNLIANPLWKRLGGPCAGCGDYFWMNRADQKAYCSRRCSAFYTALSATQRARLRAHKKKIEAAQAAINKCASRKIRGDWKKWVANSTRSPNGEPGCSAAWLTRWINKGELNVPTALKTAR
jgi:hypothetical protein